MCLTTNRIKNSDVTLQVQKEYVYFSNIGLSFTCHTICRSIFITVNPRYIQRDSLNKSNLNVIPCFGQYPAFIKTKYIRYRTVFKLVIGITCTDNYIVKSEGRILSSWQPLCFHILRQPGKLLQNRYDNSVLISFANNQYSQYQCTKNVLSTLSESLTHPCYYFLCYPTFSLHAQVTIRPSDSLRNILNCFPYYSKLK